MTNETTTSIPPDLEAGVARPAGITFEDGTRDPRVGRSARRSRSRSRSRRRSLSSGGSITAASPYSGVPIEYRTLSIQVAESQAYADDLADLKGKTVAKKDDQDYFANLNFHSLPADQLCQQLNVDRAQGLSEESAVRRLDRDGKNTLPRPQTNYAKKLFWYLFGGFCSVLWVGVLVFFLCWRPLSNPPSITMLALAILVIIVIILQASFSAFQDWSTIRTMSSILDLLPSETMVLRDGQKKRISAADLVSGDIVFLEIGNKVPADLRLLSHSGDIRFDRSILTGESEEVEGAVDCTDPNFLETRNIALMGAIVVNGGGMGVVILTGARSVMGRIASATAGVKEKPTLIQREISRFVRIIVALTIILVLLIVLTWVGWLRIQHSGFMDVVAMLNNAMGCVVAFIPEGMPIGVALTLMMVARRMKAVNILPKGLSTVETLGCVNVICSDKTGTLTKNEMRVNSVSLVDGQFDSPEDVFVELRSLAPSKGAVALYRAAERCNDASFDPTSLHLPPRDREVQGNATDSAVMRFVAGAMKGDEGQSKPPRDFEIPFNSKNKWMLTMYRNTHSDNGYVKGNEYKVYVKGAPDVLLPACTSFWSRSSDSVQPLDASAHASFKAFQDKQSRQAERVIVLCEKTMRVNSQHGTNAFSDEVAINAISDLTVVGIMGIIDPPRMETAATIAECRRAGARFFMVTGDYGLTAAAIGTQIGIFTGSRDPDTFDQVRTAVNALSGSESGEKSVSNERGSLLLEGPQIARLTNDDWDVVCQYQEIVFARTTPEQKLRIVNEFRERDNVVAVTGDGVNDAPAMRAADVGIAVITGSDVAIEASDLVLMDRFDEIVQAIRLGRLVFQNLQKVIAYLLPAGSWSEIWPVLLNQLLGVPLPLSSFLMIIICVFTDLFLSLSLIMEKEEFDLLSLPPRNHKRDHLINLRIYTQSYLFMGFMETIIAHAMYFFYMWKYARIPASALFFAYETYTDGFYGYTGDELKHFNITGQCVYFVTLVILQWGNILSVRNRRLSIIQADPFRAERRNPWLVASILISLAIAVFVTEVPAIQELFVTASVPIEFWLIPLPLALGILCMDELRKLMVRLFPNGLIARIAW